MSFSDPIATTQPPFDTIVHSQAPASFFTYSSNKPMPTNIWWEDLLVGDGQKTIYSAPYAQRMLPKGMHVSYPGRTLQPNYTLLNAEVKNFSLEMNEAVTSRAVTDYSDFGVRVVYSTAGGNMTLNVVRGMAFNSAIYSTATPLLNTIQAIITVNGQNTGINVTGTKFKFALNNGQTWVLYASSTLTLSVGGSSVTATAPFTGSLQLAVLTDAAQEAVYDASAINVLTSGNIDATYSGNASTMTFSWTATTGSPLVFTLPHHQDILQSASYTALSLRGMKGTMRAIKATSWTMIETLTTMSWDSPTPIDPTKIAEIQAALTSEKSYDPNYNEVFDQEYGVDPYFGGKKASKQARMALIAHQIGDTGARDQILASMKTGLTSWFNGTFNNDLVYDSRWKGVITQKASEASGAYFGMGWYNDHHFHYGYWIYAAAVIARFDPTWVTNNKTAVESLIRDIANPSPSDPYFPRFRSKDWFDGHSIASGLFPSESGRNQESTSEAIHAWYGMYLWGLATSNANIKDLGRLQLAQEIRSTKKYWHIYNPDTIHDAPLNNHATVGILWSTKIEYGTFFSALPECIHGIQVLPVTPITEEYADPAWVTRAYPEASSNMPSNTGWDSIIYAMHSVIAPTAAYNELKTAVLDDGASRTNSLYWGATRIAGSGATTTSTALSANPASSSAAGASVTLTATVLPSLASGSITFKDGATTLGSATVSGGTASLSTSSLAQGSHALTAVFSSSNTETYLNSTSSSLTYTVTSIGGSTTGSNANAVPYLALSAGQPLTAVRRAVADTNYTVTAKDSIIGITSLTSPRTITLPAASSVPAGSQVVIKDESGACSSTNTITLIGTINGASNLTLNAAYASAIVYSSGTSWYRLSA